MHKAWFKRVKKHLQKSVTNLPPLRGLFSMEALSMPATVSMCSRTELAGGRGTHRSGVPSKSPSGLQMILQPPIVWGHLEVHTIQK